MLHFQHFYMQSSFGWKTNRFNLGRMKASPSREESDVAKNRIFEGGSLSVSLAVGGNSFLTAVKDSPHLPLKGDKWECFQPRYFPFIFLILCRTIASCIFWINIWLVIKAVYLGCQCHSKSLLNFFMFLKPLLNWWSILIEPSPSQTFHSFWCEEKINQSLRLIDFFGRNSWNSSPWWMNSRI